MAKKTLRLDEFLPYRLSVASNAVSSVISGSYETLFGLHVPEWRLVAVLAETPNLSQQALVERTEMDKMTVSRAASALVARKLASRVPNGADKRSHLLALTEPGERLYEQVAPAALKLEADLLRGISPTEVAAFMKTLTKLKAAAARLEDE